MALSDNDFDNIEGTDNGNDESDDSSSDSESSSDTFKSLVAHKKRSPMQSPSKTHSININYCHNHRLEIQHGDTLTVATLSNLLQDTSIASATFNTSVPLSSQFPPVNVPQTPVKPKQRILHLKNRSEPLIFTELDIFDPPHIKYIGNLDGLN